MYTGGVCSHRVRGAICWDSDDVGLLAHLFDADIEVRALDLQ